MTAQDSKVIGYFAYMSRGQVICTEGDACVISGSSDAMKSYVAEIHFGDIDLYGKRLRSLTAGGRDGENRP